MKVAFYAPLKPPDHPVPSGDRLMARSLIRALKTGGNEVSLISVFRSFLSTEDCNALQDVTQQSLLETDRIAKHWQEFGGPDLWFTYHPYYKAPDLLGPALSRRFAIPYVTAEASYSRRRNQ